MTRSPRDEGPQTGVCAGQELFSATVTSVALSALGSVSSRHGPAGPHVGREASGHVCVVRGHHVRGHRWSCRPAHEPLVPRPDAPLALTCDPAGPDRHRAGSRGRHGERGPGRSACRPRWSAVVAPPAASCRMGQSWRKPGSCHGRKVRTPWQSSGHKPHSSTRPERPGPGQLVRVLCCCAIASRRLAPCSRSPLPADPRDGPHGRCLSRWGRWRLRRLWLAPDQPALPRASGRCKGLGPPQEVVGQLLQLGLQQGEDGGVERH